jgi:hypothetical protein
VCWAVSRDGEEDCKACEDAIGSWAEGRLKKTAGGWTGPCWVCKSSGLWRGSWRGRCVGKLHKQSHHRRLFQWGLSFVVSASTFVNSKYRIHPCPLRLLLYPLYVQSSDLRRVHMYVRAWARCTVSPAARFRCRTHSRGFRASMLNKHVQRRASTMRNAL